MRHRFFPPSPIQIFSVEATSVQLTWGSLPAGIVRCTIDGNEHCVDHSGGPGSLDLGGLVPNTSYKIVLSWQRKGRVDGSVQVNVHTLTAPGLNPLARFATISDLHIGARRFGALKTMTDIEPGDKPFAYRCAYSAIEDAKAWGAEFLIIKGDAVHAQSSENMSVLGELVDNFPDLPIMLLPGNHDVDRRGDLDHLDDPIGDRRLRFVSDITDHTIAGIQIIGANTTVARKGTGSILPVQDQIIAKIRPDQPTIIMLHQQLQEHRVNRYWPPGIPEEESAKFLKTLAEVSPNCLVSSGHTHRNRRRTYKNITVTEVASTRDWPGVWAGYTLYDGGVTQTVRRTSAPSAMRWHEYSRQAVGGLWSLWSPGSLDDRCFTHRWAPSVTSFSGDTQQPSN